MEVTVDIKPNIKIMSGLKQLPDKVMYSVARQTLDLAYSTIPRRKGKLRSSSMSGGVKGSNGNYYIGSYTSYASSVWKMENVNWTTPGTNNKWFARTIQRHGYTIMKNAIDKGWRQSM
jgi:hypothetical protein